MEIIVAKRTGFCFGVSRAIEEVKKVLDEKKRFIYMENWFITNK